MEKKEERISKLKGLSIGTIEPEQKLEKTESFRNLYDSQKVSSETSLNIRTNKCLFL